MDRIQMDCDIEDLNIRQITRLNKLRRRLMRDEFANSVNNKVKLAIARAFSDSTQKLDVLEWGCGYSPIRTHLPALWNYSAIDIDPRVVAHHWLRGRIECDLADRMLSTSKGQSFDLILSVFVFHFKMPYKHIEMMAKLLRPNGYILANVYRRDEESRQDLADEFAKHGLHVRRAEDPEHLCADHEFWFIARPDIVASVGPTVLERVTGSGYRAGPDAQTPRRSGVRVTAR